MAKAQHDMLINGCCHCGNIGFSLLWEPSPTLIQARACTCSFCVKHGGLWTAYSAGRLQVHIKDDARAAKYSFGTKTADFHVCAECGVVPVVTSEIEGRVYAVVSVNAFDRVDMSLVNRAPADFDGEGTGDRLARRKRNWISSVEFIYGA